MKAIQMKNVVYLQYLNQGILLIFLNELKNAIQWLAVNRKALTQTSSGEIQKILEVKMVILDRIIDKLTARHKIRLPTDYK